MVPRITTDRMRKRDSPSGAVIEAVAEEIGVDPTELPPIAEEVDAEALDAIFDSTPIGSARRGTTRFQYNGYEITVIRDDEISIQLEDRCS